MNVYIKLAKNGKKTLFLDKKALYSIYDPLKEVENFIKKILINSQKNNIFILYADPLSYISESLLKKGVLASQIYILQKGFVENKDFPIFSFKEIEKFLLEGKKPILVVYPSLERFFKKEVEDTFLLFQSFYQKALFNIKIQAFFSRTWFRNFMHNCLQNKVNPFYLYEKDKLKLDVPILALAGGWSLDDFLPKLENIKNHVTIFSLLSNWGALEKFHIIPDAFFITDGGVANKLYTQNLPPNVPIFCSIYASYSALSKLANPKILIDISKDSVPSFQLKDPSVTIAMLDIATQISKKVFSLGFDLSFHLDKKTHATGYALEEKNNHAMSFLNSQESISYSYLKDPSLLELDKDIYASFEQRQIYQDEFRKKRTYKWINKSFKETSQNTIFLKDFKNTKKQKLDLKTLSYWNSLPVFEKIMNALKTNDKKILQNAFLRYDLNGDFTQIINLEYQLFKNINK